MNQCVQFRKKNLGADHPDTMSSIRALEQWQADEWWYGPYGAMVMYGSIFFIAYVLELLIRKVLPFLILGVLSLFL